MANPVDWRLGYLKARVEAADRAEEVLSVLLESEDEDQAVRQLASMLRVDEQAARGVLEHWGAGLSQGDRLRARSAVADYQRELDGA